MRAMFPQSAIAPAIGPVQRSEAPVFATWHEQSALTIAKWWLSCDGS